MRTAVLLLGLTSSLHAQFEDPAPPKVNVLDAVEAPKAAAFEGLTVHRAPSPLAEAALTEDWPTFLGPRRDGTSLESLSGLIERGPRLVWEIEVGEGYSQPVVASGRVILHHRQGNTSHIDCVDAETGQRYWRRSLACNYRARYISDAGPRATPTIADGWVYVHSVEGKFLCLELTTGRVRWERDLTREFGLGVGFFGVVASPLVVGDRIYVNVGVPGPSVACFDAATGRILWGTGEDWGASCASPVMGVLGGKLWLLVITGGESQPPTGGLMVLDPEDGALAFAYPFRSRTTASVNAACPLVVGDDIFLTSSYGVGAAAIRAEEGEFSELWKDRRGLGLQFSNPLRFGASVVAIEGTSDRAGELVTIDPRTGKELTRTPLGWEEEVVYSGRELTRDFSVGEGSLLLVDGKVLCLGDQGHLLWMELGDEGAEVLGREWLFRAPALSSGLLFVRQTGKEIFGAEPAGRRVMCFDVR